MDGLMSSKVYIRMFISDDNFYSHINPYDSSLCEMIEAGRFEDCKLCVYANEGPIPHFHFYSKTGGDYGGGCIRLDLPEYFNHGNHTEKLNRRNIKRVQEWAKSPHRLLGRYGLNNWEAMCIYWNDSNPDHPLPDNLEMPDYSKLK